MAKKYYITSAIPYVNAKPHIGHALEFVQSDTIARYHKLLGEDVQMLCGGDENALKNVQAAEKDNSPVQEFVDKNNQAFFELTKRLNCEYDVWQKGSDQARHFPSSQKLWQLCSENGDIYEKEYEGLYCVGCEAFYTKEELNENGECFEHPGKPLEKIKEKNYFFKLSNYTDKIKELIESDEIKIYPEHRKKEILEFLKQGLEDISISRSNERAKNWGVPVPDDPTQRMYVWFDALNIYQSGIGFGWDETNYNKWWPADIHVIGKGILRFHAVYWPAFLLSAHLPLPKGIFVHDYFTVNGQKMSKTLGNVIDPNELIDKYGADPLRYYFLAKFSPFNDGDFSEEKFKETYNADLANGLGNLVARVAKLAEPYDIDQLEINKHKTNSLWQNVETEFLKYRFDSALSVVWGAIQGTDTYLSKERPWLLDLSNEDQSFSRLIIIKEAVKNILEIVYCLQPFLPETAAKIQKQFSGKIKSGEPLFPRLQ